MPIKINFKNSNVSELPFKRDSHVSSGLSPVGEPECPSQSSVSCCFPVTLPSTRATEDIGSILVPLHKCREGDTEGLGNAPTTTGLGEWLGQTHTHAVCRRAGGPVSVLKACTARPTLPFASLFSPLSTCLTVSQEPAVPRVGAALRPVLWPSAPRSLLTVCTSVWTHTHIPPNTQLCPPTPPTLRHIKDTQMKKGSSFS